MTMNNDVSAGGGIGDGNGGGVNGNIGGVGGGSSGRGGGGGGRRRGGSSTIPGFREICLRRRRGEEQRTQKHLENHYSKPCTMNHG